MEVSVDRDADGTPDEVRELRYDRHGQPLNVFVAFGEHEYVHVYDPDGNLRLTDMDVDGDGTPEQRRVYGYDCWV